MTAGARPAPAPRETLAFAGRVWNVRRPKSFVLVFEGPADDTEPDYLHDVLVAPAWREAFFRLVDTTGLVVCKNLATRHPTYRDVRGRSSKGRLSQGEYYHHDGCSGPRKPRIVEIRCPYQDVARGVATAIAPHRAVVRAMLDSLPDELAAAGELDPWRARLDGVFDAEELDPLQGLMNRAIRRALPAGAARAYFREVDARADAYVEPWGMGESRLIANAHTPVTMQHRRAYLTEHRTGEPNGNLVKRWPDEELVGDGTCALDDDGE